MNETISDIYFFKHSNYVIIYPSLLFNYTFQEEKSIIGVKFSEQYEINEINCSV